MRSICVAAASNFSEIYVPGHPEGPGQPHHDPPRGTRDPRSLTPFGASAKLPLCIRMAWDHLADHPISAVNFNIVHVRPPDNAPALGSFDVARLLYFSFQSLGHPVTLQINRLELSAINIIVGYEQLPSVPAQPNLRCIPYQLEQLPSGGSPFSQRFLTTLLGSKEVWDYDPKNIEVLKTLGVRHASLLTLGYHEKLNTIPQREEDVDVLFYGLLNERRCAVLERLNAKCRVRALQSIYGQERDEWISRSKIVLNMHYYPAKMAEQVRVSYLLNNGRCVVSEQSDWDPLGQWCTVAPYEQLVDICLGLLSNETERRRRIAVARDGFGQQRMSENLRKVLEHVPQHAA